MKSYVFRCGERVRVRVRVGVRVFPCFVQASVFNAHEFLEEVLSAVSEVSSLDVVLTSPSLEEPAEVRILKRVWRPDNMPVQACLAEKARA